MTGGRRDVPPFQLYNGICLITDNEVKYGKPQSG
jgi:hypothetical protein